MYLTFLGSWILTSNFLRSSNNIVNLEQCDGGREGTGRTATHSLDVVSASSVEVSLLAELSKVLANRPNHDGVLEGGSGNLLCLLRWESLSSPCTQTPKATVWGGAGRQPCGKCIRKADIRAAKERVLGGRGLGVNPGE